MNESQFLGYQKSEPKYLTQEELTAFFLVIKDPRDMAMFDLTYKYGLRASEIGLLTLNDIDFETNQIFIHRLKKSASHVYVLYPDSRMYLIRYLSSRMNQTECIFSTRRRRPISRQHVFHLYRKYYDLAGLKNPSKRHPHCLRHSLAVHLNDADVNLMTVKRMLGHKSINSTLWYVNVSERKRKEDFEKINQSGMIVNIAPETYPQFKTAKKAKKTRKSPVLIKAKEAAPFPRIPSFAPFKFKHEIE